MEIVNSLHKNLANLCIYILLLNYGCSTSKPKVSALDWKPSYDQVFTNSEGKISFARTHFIIPKDGSLNDILETKVLAFMDKACQKSKTHVIRQFESESDFITLKNNYFGNPRIKVYEFLCH